MSAAAPIAALPQRLTVKEKLGFGVGDFAFNLFWQGTSLYLLFFYTDILGLAPATAAWIFGLAMLWDAVSDPFMGFIANRTRSRWGRYRPYLLFGCVPLAISYVVIFIPTGLEGTALLVFALASQILFRTLYTVLSMPYSSLMATMTQDSQARGSLAAFRMCAATFAGLFVAFSTLKLVAIFGQGDAHRGFFLVAALYAAISIPIFLITFQSAREQGAMMVDEKPLMWALALRMVVHNHAFLLVAVFTVFQMASSTFLGKTLPYLLKYIFLREDLIGAALGITALFVFLSVPIWAWVMRRTSKKAVALAGGALGMMGYGAMALMPLGSLPLFFANLVLLGIANAAGYLSFWAMMPDTVEYGEWKSGVRGEGVLFGVVSFIQKAALALAVIVLGNLLTMVGYQANVAQSAETLRGLHLLASLAPMVLLALAMLAILAYPLSPQRHAAIVADIQNRRK